MFSYEWFSRKPVLTQAKRNSEMAYKQVAALFNPDHLERNTRYISLAKVLIVVL